MKLDSSSSLLKFLPMKMRRFTRGSSPHGSCTSPVKSMCTPWYTYLAPSAGTLTAGPEKGGRAREEMGARRDEHAAQSGSARGGEGGLRAPRDVERPQTEDVAGDASSPGTIGEADAEVGVGVMSLVVFPPSRGGFVQEIAPIRATRENAHDGLQREACAA